MKPNKTPRKHAAFASSSRQMKRRPKVKSLLAVLVAFCTVCALTMPAATLEGQAQASCGLAEHTHDESCYESVLVCGQEESEGHVHDESCYEEVLTCEIPEHTHSEACWAQPETQAEAGNEENSEAVTGDGAGSDMEADAGTETGTDTEADTGTGTGTDSSENGDAAEAGSETDSSGNAGTGAGDNGSAESGAESGDGQTGNDGAGSEADGTAENGSGTENAGEQDESTSAEDALTEADKTEQAENPQAAEEAAEMPDGATVPEGYTEQYTVRDEENGFAVTVYAPEGVVPEGAVLSAELLSEETEEYVAAEQELAAETEAVMAENGVSALSEDGADAASEDGEAAAPSYGFAALDIHFEYENGEEVEPNGDVYVVIDAAGLLPEDADPESVTVQHHAEQEDGSVTVETVADTAEETAGVVAVVENEAQAENDVQAAFGVDGFSTFIIRWGYNGGYRPFLTIQLIDSEGNNIGGDVSIGSGSLNRETPINSIVDMIAAEDDGNVLDGYEFSRSVVASDEQSALELGEDSYIQRIRYQSYRWQYNTNESGGDQDWTDIYPIRGDELYLIYDSDESSRGGDGGEITQNATVTTGKTVNAKDDNYNYDLTLSVTGDRGSSSQKQAVDIVFILDKSGSMNRRLNSDSEADWYEDSRMDLLEDAVGSLVTTIENNDDIDARYSAVGFSGDGKSNHGATTTRDWTSNSQTLINYVENLTPDGGTNYQLGIYEAKQLLNSARSDALTFVVFVSDGIPTYRGIENQSGDGQNDSEGKNIAAAVNEIKNMNCNYFYAIGMGPEFGQEYWGSDKLGTTNLKKLANAVNAQFKGDDHVFSANDTETLEDAFDDIAGSITFFAADHVVMTDSLSKWVDIVPNSDGEVSFEVKLEKQNATGQYEEAGKQIVASGEEAEFTTLAENEEGQESPTTFSITPIWTPNPEGSETPGTITVNFDENYELAPGYRYSVTTTITPNESARAEGTDGYNGIGEENTGTHSGADGFWSNVNENAKVSYQVTGVPGDEPFPKPVVQVPEEVTGDLVITKEVAGATVDGKEYTFIISTSNENVAGKGYVTDTNETVTFSNTPEAGLYKAEVKVSASSNPDTVDGSITVKDLPEGVYTVEEQEPDELAGYLFNGTSYRVNGAESNRVTVDPDITAQIDVTNAYVPLTDITIKKVDSSNKDITLKDAGFILYYKTETDEKRYYSISGSEVFWTANKDEATELSSNEEGTVKFMELRKDITYYLVETKAPDGYNLLEHEVKISWDSEGKIQASYGTTPIRDIDQAERIITVTNSTGTELPETGGPGTTILTIGGLLLMAGAVGGGYGLRRRRGKEGR